MYLQENIVYELDCDIKVTWNIAKNSKWVWSGNTTITNRRQPCGTARNSRSTFKLWVDALTHKIWNSYLKEYWRYAQDSMQFLETRSEVKFKVTETQLYYLTLCHPKMHLHTDFEIPTSNNIRDMLRTRLLKKTRSEVKVTMTFKWHVTLRHPKKAFTHQIWNSYLKEYRRYAPDSMQFLKTRSEVKFKVTVTQ